MQCDTWRIWGWFTYWPHNENKTNIVNEPEQVDEPEQVPVPEQVKEPEDHASQHSKPHCIPPDLNHIPALTIGPE